MDNTINDLVSRKNVKVGNISASDSLKQLDKILKEQQKELYVPRWYSDMSFGQFRSAVFQRVEKMCEENQR